MARSPPRCRSGAAPFLGQMHYPVSQRRSVRRFAVELRVHCTDQPCRIVPRPHRGARVGETRHLDGVRQEVGELEAGHIVVLGFQLERPYLLGPHSDGAA